jgi:hypothetical protein
MVLDGDVVMVVGGYDGQTPHSASEKLTKSSQLCYTRNRKTEKEELRRVL